MVQQERLHSKIFGTLITVVFMLSCGHNQLVVPSVYINADRNFKTQQGITSLDNKPFSGWQFALYENKDTAFVMPYYNGKENGISKAWYQNKQVKEIRLFEQGKKTGVHQGWWPDGSPRFEYHFANDIYEGNVKEWNEAGLLFKDFNYKNGQENGLQKQFFSDGSIQFNYEARNGRNYGWTGVKNCVNVKDSLEKNK